MVRWFPKDIAVISKIRVMYSKVLAPTCLFTARDTCPDGKTYYIPLLVDKLSEMVGTPVTIESKSFDIISYSYVLVVRFTPTIVYQSIDTFVKHLSMDGWRTEINFISTLFYCTLLYSRKSICYTVKELLKCPFVDDFKCVQVRNTVKVNAVLSSSFMQSNLTADKFYAMTAGEYAANKGMCSTEAIITTSMLRTEPFNRDLLFITHKCRLRDFRAYHNAFTLSKYLCILTMSDEDITFGVVS